MKKIQYFLTFIFLFMIFGCNEFLNILPDDKPVLEDAFKDRNNAEKYLFTCYRFMPTFANPLNSLGLTGGGDIMYSDLDKGLSMPSGTPEPMLSFFKGNIVSTPYMNFWDGQNGANRNIWQGIRHCNVFWKIYQ